MKKSPLINVWDGSGEKECKLIVIDDDIPIVSNSILNIVFSRIRDYEYKHGDYANPFQRMEFWKNIRRFIEVNHPRIVGNGEELRRLVLSSRVYDYVCTQEDLFASEIDDIWKQN